MCLIKKENSLETGNNLLQLEKPRSLSYACIGWHKMNDEYRLTNNDLRYDLNISKIVNRCSVF